MQKIQEQRQAAPAEREGYAVFEPRKCKDCGDRLHGKIKGELCVQCRMKANGGNPLPPKTAKAKATTNVDSIFSEYRPMLASMEQKRAQLDKAIEALRYLIES